MQQPDLFHAPDPAHLAPRARATDPATSHDAARAFRGKAWRGGARRGKAGGARPGSARQGEAGKGFNG